MGKRGERIDQATRVAIKEAYEKKPETKSSIINTYTKKGISYKTILKYMKLDMDTIKSMETGKHHRKDDTLIRGLPLQVFNEIARAYSLPASKIYNLLQSDHLHLKKWLGNISLSTCSNMVKRVFSIYDRKRCTISDERQNEINTARNQLKKWEEGTIAIHVVPITWKQTRTGIIQTTRFWFALDRGCEKFDTYGYACLTDGISIEDHINEMKRVFQPIKAIRLVTNAEGVPTAYESVDKLREIFGDDMVFHDVPTTGGDVNIDKKTYTTLYDLDEDIEPVILTDGKTMNKLSNKKRWRRY